MRIQYIQHVPFEGPENIDVWAKKQGHGLTGTFMFEKEPRFPQLSEFDMLIVLGGPMSTYDEAAYPWLVQEKQWIREALRQKKLVLGICLGAQLLAEAIGGRVSRNEFKEIGWFPVKLSDGARASKFFRDFPDVFVPFHWHGDTFRLPSAARTIGFSRACLNQAFEYEGHAVGLQFHLETKQTGIKKLLDHCAGELEEGAYIQKPEQMLNQNEYMAHAKLILFALLDAFERSFLTVDQAAGQ